VRHLEGGDHFGPGIKSSILGPAEGHVGSTYTWGEPFSDIKLYNRSMNDSFSFIATIFTFFQIVVFLFYCISATSYFSLYEKKKNSNNPIFTGDIFGFLDKNSKNFFKVFFTPFFMWRAIFERHKDKELNNAAKQVRILVFLFFGSLILEHFLIIITTPNLNFRWGS